MHLPLNCSVMERFPMLLKGGCGAALGLSSPSALACPFESANTNGRGQVSTEVVRGGMVAVRTGKQRPLVDVQRMPLWRMCDLHHDPCAEKDTHLKTSCCGLSHMHWALSKCRDIMSTSAMEPPMCYRDACLPLGHCSSCQENHLHYNP